MNATEQFVWSLLFPTPGITEAIKRVEARDAELRADAQREPLKVLREFLELRRLGILIEFTPSERPDGTVSEDPAGDSLRVDRAHDKAEALLAAEPKRTEATE